MTKIINLRPAEPDRDFGQLANWFAVLEEWSLSEQGLREYYEKRRERVIPTVAVDDRGNLLGFTWIYRSEVDTCFIDLYVSPDQRRQGVGSRLYEDAVRYLNGELPQMLHTNVSDMGADSRAFAEKRGFVEKGHAIAMSLNLDTFDDRPYSALIARLESEGFQFTSMEALGNTEEAQRSLYQLNETTNRETPGTDGSPAWDSFEDFQKSVIQANWYRPDGQMLVIDTTNGMLAAMCAITRPEGKGYAYNLHTGVYKTYRGRKIAQAVKVLALRYAREVLQVHEVHTHHTAKNLPILAIDRKFGYVQTPGMYSMLKELA